MGKKNPCAPVPVLCGVLAVVLTFLLTVTMLCFPAVAATGLTAAGAETVVPGGLLCVRAAAAEGEEGNLIGGEGSGLINILLIGKDQWEGTSGRSDCLILFSFHRATRKITMTSILRDLYVPIPGYEANRINAAYAFGGTELLKKTLLQNFDLWIDGCVEVDFSGFARVIDLLGGVKLHLRADEARQINLAVAGNLTEGEQRLTGEQALAYTRLRKLDSDGDFSRTGRQRKVLKSLLESYETASPLKIMSVAAKVLPLLSTDMEYDDILSTVLEVLPLLEGNTVSGQHIPAEGQFRYETIRDMAVITADPEKVKAYLRETLTDVS